MKIDIIEKANMDRYTPLRWFFGSLGLGIVVLVVAGKVINRAYRFWYITR